MLNFLFTQSVCAYFIVMFVMLCFCFLKHTDLVYFLPWIGLLFHLNWLTLFLLKLTFARIYFLLYL